MEGKTKEKLESMGLAFLILSLRYNNPMDSWGKRGESILQPIQNENTEVYCMCYLYM